ncbi:MAG: hypothetical protein HYY29_06040 [Chloroflexi bacterium]|nr:hypothetical protein [Chloroflexota bacterium]
MTYKAYDIMVLAMIMILGFVLTIVGFMLRTRGLGEVIWWLVAALGIVLLIAGISSIGFCATQADEMPCPHCGKKAVPMVKLSSGHVFLSGKGDF